MFNVDNSNVESTSPKNVAKQTPRVTEMKKFNEEIIRQSK